MKAFVFCMTLGFSLGAHAGSSAQPGRLRSTAVQKDLLARSEAIFEIQSGARHFQFSRSSALKSELQDGLPESYPHRPSVFIKRGTRTTQLDLGPKHQGYGWVYAAASTDAKQVWGVLDWEIAEPGPELLFLRSTDSGAHWQFTSPLVKPNHMCQFLSLALDAKGVGEAQVECFDTHPSPGLYVSSTLDAGKSWSPYRHVPSILNAATPK